MRIIFCLMMGWVAAAAAPAADKEPGRHLFILSGQSNMRRPLDSSFKSSVEQVLGKDKVLVAMVAHPSQPLKKWVSDWTPPKGMEDAKPEDNGSIYERLIKKVKGALKESKPASVTFIWMQGEADAGKSWASVYEKSFLALLEQFKTDLDIPEIHFVVGRINEHWLSAPDGKAIREILVKLGDEHTNGAWINTDDLNRGVNPWGGYSFEDGHFPPQGYVVMGQRFAKAACELLGVDVKAHAEVFQEQFIDSHEQIKSHAAIGKAVSCNHPTSKIVAESGHAILTDGHFGGADHGAVEWVGFAPSEKPIELIVDLGAPMVIEELGVNLLLSSKAKAEFPAKLIFSTSEDGKEFVVKNARHNTISFANKKALKAMRATGIEPQSVLPLTGQTSVHTPDWKPRYAKITIETGDQHVYLDEIVVNPVRK